MKQANRVVSARVTSRATLSRRGYDYRAPRVEAAKLLSGLLFEVSDEVPPIGFMLHARIGHLVARHKGRRILQILEEIVLRPEQALGPCLLVCLRVGKACNRTRLAPDDAI